MNLLVTAGNTRVFLDQVRCLTNIFTGRTGAAIALEALRRGHGVTLLTSHPDLVLGLMGEAQPVNARLRTLSYQTLDELRQRMEQQVRESTFDSVIHSAAVSDYSAAGIYAPAAGTRFLHEQKTWRTDGGTSPTLVDRAAGKIKSDEPELWLRLLRAPKLVDMIRAEWGFRGTLVKFKLEVGLDDAQLLAIAEKSRTQSQADLMVANTLEGASSWAYIGPLSEGYLKISRRELPAKLMDALETMAR